MVNVPSALPDPVKTSSELSGCGTSAATPLAKALFCVQSMGTARDPLAFQYVSTQLRWTVPLGVTIQDCVALAPPLVVAVTVKLLGRRDCAGVGVQVSVLPLSDAPAGDCASEKATVPPAGSVAVIG